MYAVTWAVTPHLSPLELNGLQLCRQPQPAFEHCPRGWGKGAAAGVLLREGCWVAPLGCPGPGVAGGRSHQPGAVSTPPVLIRALRDRVCRYRRLHTLLQPVANASPVPRGGSGTLLQPRARPAGPRLVPAAPSPSGLYGVLGALAAEWLGAEWCRLEGWRGGE